MEAPVTKLYALVFVVKEHQVLLGYKKRGFGSGKWNGFGGEVDPDEKISDAAARKVKEGCCLNVKPEDLQHLAHLEFTFERQPKTMMEVRVFSAFVYEGMPTETRETKPKWFKKVSLHYEDMGLDSKLWLPYVLACKAVFGTFKYDCYDKILKNEVEIHLSMEAFYENRKRELDLDL